MTRIGTRSLLFAVDGGSGYVDYTDAVSRVILVAKERTRLFGEPSFEFGGARGYQLALTTPQDTADNSLWHLTWTSPSILVPFYLAPHGNWTASAEEPHYSGYANIVGPDGTVLGGDAAASRKAVLTTEMTWPVRDTPTEITEGAYPADLPEGW